MALLLGVLNKEKIYITLDDGTEIVVSYKTASRQMFIEAPRHVLIEREVIRDKRIANGGERVYRKDEAIRLLSEHIGSHSKHSVS